MTETEWMACKHPRPMLEFMHGKASVRKYRLFAIACCRRIMPLILKTKLGPRALVLADQLAEGQCVAENLMDFRGRLWNEGFSQIDGFREEIENNVIWNSAHAAFHTLQEDAAYAGQVSVDSALLWEACDHAAWAAANSKRRTDRKILKDQAFVDAVAQEEAAQIPLLHDVFGNPFKAHLAIRPCCPAWNDGAVSKIAQVIYDDRAFDRLPLLADALEDAGCDDADVLGHCRSGGEHVRGCWVVDLLLAKK